MVGLLYGVMVLVWSTTWWAIHVSHQSFTPAWGAAWRFILAAACMLPFARATRGHASWRVAAAIGLLGYALNYTASYGAVALLPSGTAAVLFASSPLFTAAWAAVLLPGTSLRPATIVGLVLAVGGVAVIQGALALPADGLWAALGYVALGTQSQALTTVVSRRAGPGADPVATTARAMIVGAVLLVGLALGREGVPVAPWHAGGRAWAALLYLAIPGTCLTFTIFYWLVARTGPLLPSTAAVVCPVLAMVFGALVGDEPLTARLGAGALLGAFGTGLATWANRPRTPPAPASGAPARPGL